MLDARRSRFEAIVGGVEAAILRRLLARVNRRSAPRLRPVVLPGDVVSSHILSEGFFERAELSCLLRLLRKQARDSELALDIGANIGNHALFLYPHVAGVIAVEPDPRARAFLELAVAHVPAGKIQIVPVGFDETAGENPFGREGDQNLGAVTMFGCERGKAGAPTLTVVRGDDWFAQHRPEIWSGRRKIGLVKCDVEGLEPRVFAGLRAIFTKHKPLVMFESLMPDVGNQAIEQLQQCGYSHFAEMVGTLQKPWVGKIKHWLRYGERIQLLPLQAAPDRAVNVVASFEPLPAKA